MEVWRCDVCKVRTFRTLQEACDHEATCTVSVAAVPPPSTIISSTTSSISSIGDTSAAPTAAADAVTGMDVVGAENALPNHPTLAASVSPWTPVPILSRSKRKAATAATLAMTRTIPTPTITTTTAAAIVSRDRNPKNKPAVVSAAPSIHPFFNTSAAGKNRHTSNDTAAGTVVYLDMKQPTTHTQPAEKASKKLKKSNNGAGAVGGTAPGPKSRTSAGAGAACSFLSQAAAPCSTTLTTAVSNRTTSTTARRRHTTTVSNKKRIIDLVEDEDEDETLDMDNITSISNDDNAETVVDIAEQRALLQFKSQRRQRDQMERDKRERQRLRRIAEENEQSTVPDNNSNNKGSLICKPPNKHFSRVITIIDDSDDNTGEDHVWMVEGQGNAAVSGKENSLQQSLGSVKSKTTQRPSPHAVTGLLPPLFPVPSHVIPLVASSDYTDKHNTHVDPTIATAAIVQPMWFGSLRKLEEDKTGPHGAAVFPTDNDRDDWVYPHLFPIATDANDTFPMDRTSRHCLVSMLQARLSKLFVSKDSIKNQTSSHTRATSGLLVDRYYNSSNDNSNNLMINQAAHDQLQDFIERFMVERQLAEERMAERQRRMKGASLSKSHKKTATGYRNKKHADDEDFLWDDDDLDEEDDEKWHQSSMCVLTGPVGSGKSALVHRVAQQLGCRKVLELHTGMKRSAASIRRNIEEATQSHSTLEMLRKKKKEENNALSFFQMKSKRPSKTTKGNDSIVGINDCKNKSEESSAVTVVLIDEADNLYEEDAGFWTALADLYKNSKSPIVLTANTLPKELESSTFRFTHVAMKRPTVNECAALLQNVLRSEEILDCLEEDPLFSISALEDIAILGNCDMRRVIHDFQLFTTREGRNIDPKRLTAGKAVYENSRTADARRLSPQVDEVKPQTIYVDQYNFLTIKGSNFLCMASSMETSEEKRRECNVYVADQCCPKACILNDSTIVAVVAPLKDVNSNNMTNMITTRRMHRSPEFSYAPVVVSSVHKLGILFTSSGTLSLNNLHDQTVVAKNLTSIECYAVDKRNDGANENGDVKSDSETELEFTDLTPISKVPQYTTEISTVNHDTVSTILTEGIYAWESVHGPIPLISIVESAMPDTEDLHRIEACWRDASFASDSAFMEDCGLTGIPFLAGSSRGFGFDLTDQFPKRTNENSKP